MSTIRKFMAATLVIAAAATAALLSPTAAEAQVKKRLATPSDILGLITGKTKLLTSSNDPPMRGIRASSKVVRPQRLPQPIGAGRHRWSLAVAALATHCATGTRWSLNSASITAHCTANSPKTDSARAGLQGAARRPGAGPICPPIASGSTTTTPAHWRPPRENILQLLLDAVVPSKDELAVYRRKVHKHTLVYLARRPLKLVRHMRGTTFYHKRPLPPGRSPPIFIMSCAQTFAAAKS